jgi:hypothetical protein
MDKTKSSVEFGTIRNVLRHHQDSSRKQPDFYRVDSPSVSSYFGCNKDYKKQISNYFSKLRDNGAQISHLDICGKATVQSLGGDISYCFSLGDRSNIDYQGNRIFQGDIFRERDFSRFLNDVESHIEAPALITFRPIVGLQDNNPVFNEEKYEKFREITEGILEKRFGQCVDILRRWGYMYIESPFQFENISHFFNRIPQEEWRVSRQIKKLAEKYHCNVKIKKSICGPEFLIRKRIN